MIEDYRVVSARIRQELKELDQVTFRADRAIAAAKRQPGDQDLYIDSAALSLHDLYSGLERIFHYIASSVDTSMPASHEWHRELLRQMSLEIPELRPVVLSQESVNVLSEYLAFRHVVRNVYAFQFDPVRVERLVNGLPSVMSKVKADLESFASFLEQVVSQTETGKD